MFEGHRCEVAGFGRRLSRLGECVEYQTCLGQNVTLAHACDDGEHQMKPMVAFIGGIVVGGLGIVGIG